MGEADSGSALEQAEPETGTAAQSVDQSLAEDSKQRLRSLAGTRWRGLMDSLPMREVGDFADEVGVEANIAGLKELTRYSRRLRDAVDLFDVLHAESLLSQYPQHLRTLGILPSPEDET